MKFREKMKWSFPSTSFLDKNRNIDKEKAKKWEEKAIEEEADDAKKRSSTLFQFKPPNLVKRDRRSFKTPHKFRKLSLLNRKLESESDTSFDIRQPPKQTMSSGLEFHGKSALSRNKGEIQVLIPSCLNSENETVDFSALVKQVDRLQRKRHPKLNCDILEDGNENVKEVNISCEIKQTQSNAGQRSNDIERNLDHDDVYHDFVRELSPTCSDIYGNDEIENVTFGLCAQLNAENSGVTDNNAVDKSLIQNTCKGSILSTQYNGLVRKTKVKTGLLEDTNGHGIDTQVDEHKGTGDLTDDPWVLQESIRNNQIEVVDTNNYCCVKVVNKSVHDPQLYESFEESLNSSFGFEVKHNDILHDLHEAKLSKTDSMESLDSFGSSVQSVHSNELYFSDSEAVHDIDQIVGNDSDIYEPKKQIIPYSLSELRSEGTSTPKSIGKRLKSSGSSFEERFNDFAKHCLQIMEGKGNDVDEDKQKDLLNKQSRSFDDSFTSEHSVKDKVKKLKQNRRSLDSSLYQKDYMHQVDDVGKRKSLLASSTELLLTPVLEAESKVTEKLNSPKKSNHDDSKKFYTLPNPRKHKQGTPVRRKSSRLGSLSKMFSEKAHSITNLKLVSSFKLRNDDEGSNSETTWNQLSLSANSLANLVVKKATNISTMIRKRSNSNTVSTDVADSPFNRFAKKKNTVKKDEYAVDVVYEKVLVSVPRKRQVTVQEEKCRKKRLKLNVDLANSTTKDSPDGHISVSVSRSTSFASNLIKSDSQSPLRSPTLLDEIMKSVDPAIVHRMCSMIGADDDDVSSDCDSSIGSSLFLFQKRYSLESDASEKKRDSLLMTYCRVCGRIRSSSDGSTESSDGDVRISSRQAVSLCDLTKPCTCMRRSNMHRKVSKQSQGSDRKSWVIFGENEKGDTQSEFFGIPRSGSLSAKSFSVGDLVESNKLINSIVTENLEEKEDKVNLFEAVPGSLLRHEHVLDLSVDSLDKTMDSESEFLKNEDRKSYSCGSLGDRNYIPRSLCEDEDSFHSCTDVTETDNTESLIDKDEKRQKSHSCGNLLNTSDIIVCDKLSKTGQERKELRKVKVKSMSSSHDVLNQIGDIEGIDINVEEIESAVLIEKEKTFNELNHGVKSGNGSKKDNMDVRRIGDEERENKGSIKCECCGDLTFDCKTTKVENYRKVLKEIDDTSKIPNIIIDTKSTVLTTKPPLPFHKTHKRYTSVGDIIISDNKENNSGNTNRHRYSVGDLLSDTVHGIKDLDINTAKSKTKAHMFLFDEKSINAQINHHKKLERTDRRKSLSSNDISNLRKLQIKREKLLSIHSMNTVCQETYPDDVFPPFTVMPSEIPHPLSDFEGIASPGLGREELPSFGEESVFKYDVCLGYLLHTIECDEAMICVYSLQRNKQFMESMITPLAALPGCKYESFIELKSLNSQCATFR